MKFGKILIPYIIITFITYFILNAYGLLNGRNIFNLLFGFQSNGYAWYIEMYLGLYLLIPFINSGYNRLKKENKEALIFLMIFLTVIPNLINIFGNYFQDYWTGLFPFTYYIIGMYLKEYGLNMKTHNKLFVLAISTTIHFIMAITLFRADIMGSFGNGYNNLFCLINSVMVFDLLANINTENLKPKTKKNLANLAEAVLPSYLISYIVDFFLYGIFVVNFIPTVEMRILLMIPIVMIASFFSITLGRMVTSISNKILKIWRK